MSDDQEYKYTNGGRFLNAGRCTSVPQDPTYMSILRSQSCGCSIRTCIRIASALGAGPLCGWEFLSCYTFYKRSILWKQGIHQRTENCRVYRLSGPEFFAYWWLKMFDTFLKLRPEHTAVSAGSELANMKTYQLIYAISKELDRLVQLQSF